MAGDTDLRQWQFCSVLVAEFLGFDGLDETMRKVTHDRIRGLLKDLRARSSLSTTLTRHIEQGFFLAELDLPEELLEAAFAVLANVGGGGGVEIRMALHSGRCLIGQTPSGPEITGPDWETACGLVGLARPGQLLATGAYVERIEQNRRRTFHPVGRLGEGDDSTLVMNVYDERVGNAEAPDSRYLRPVESDDVDLDDFLVEGHDAALCHLLRMSGSHFGDLVPVTSGMIAGRSEECALRLDDQRASRQHSIFVERRGVLAVRDMGSRMGVVVDGVQVDEHPLKPGQILVLGGSWFRVIEVPEGRARAVRDREMRRVAAVDARTGFLRFAHFVERLSVERARAKRAGRPLYVVGIASTVIRRFRGEPHGEIGSGFLWRQALGRLHDSLDPWDFLGATNSLDIAYAVFCECTDRDGLLARLKATTKEANDRGVDLVGFRGSPKLRATLLEAQKARYPPVDELLAKVRRSLER